MLVVVPKILLHQLQANVAVVQKPNLNAIVLAVGLQGKDVDANMETLHLFLLQIQCIAILFTLWKMRQWQKQDKNKRNNLHLILSKLSKDYDELVECCNSQKNINRDMLNIIINHGQHISNLQENPNK